MDEHEQNDLQKDMETVIGHLSNEKVLQKRNGRGFKWNATTGEYTPL